MTYYKNFNLRVISDQLSVSSSVDYAPQNTKVQLLYQYIKHFYMFIQHLDIHIFILSMYVLHIRKKNKQIYYI